MEKAMMAAVRRSFVAGILTLVPLIVTFWVFRFLFNFFDGLLAPFDDRAFGRHVPGLGLALSLLLVLSVGAIASNMVGKKILAYVSKILENTPLVKTVYSAAKQMVSALSPAGGGLKRVVLIEYPRKGIYSIGFLTSRAGWQVPAGRDRKWVSVLVPAALNPTSGMVVVVPEEELLDPGFSVEEGIKLVVSGGFVAPES
ncbi:MAG: DUF502 domain-containing protein [Thermoanaerobaculia bacterium]